MKGPWHGKCDFSLFGINNSSIVKVIVAWISQTWKSIYRPLASEVIERVLNWIVLMFNYNFVSIVLRREYVLRIIPYRKIVFRCSKMQIWYSNFWKRPYRGKGVSLLTHPPPTAGFLQSWLYCGASVYSNSLNIPYRDSVTILWMCSIRSKPSNYKKWYLCQNYLFKICSRNVILTLTNAVNSTEYYQQPICQ